MKIIIATDSFKGSLTAKKVCFFIEKGLKKSIPAVETICLPIADGGEGSLEAITEAVKGKYFTLKVINPVGKKINAKYSVFKNNAVIEMAQASGITLITDEEKNSFLTTSYGTGQLIADAIRKDIKNIYLCIGGSATVDGGAGMLQALGVEFYDKNNRLIKEFINNKLLGEVSRIETKNFLEKTVGIKITILSDVKNILFGKDGSVYTFAIQKGAEKEDLPILENNMKNFYDIVEKNHRKVHNIKGSGAAGGMGASVLAFFDSEIKSGIEHILKLINFSEKLENANIIITGEGSIDKQTLKGKVISGIVNNAKNIPVIAIAGSLNDLEKINKMGVYAAFSICNKPMDLEEAKLNAEYLVESLSIQIGNLLKLNFK